MIRLENVSKYYHNEGIVTLGLRNINLHFHIGEFVVITGESGSGKTTLLNVISGSDSYEDGEMYVAGKETSYYDARDWETYRRDKIGFIFQNYNLIDSFSVLRNVEAALVIQGLDRKTRRRRALDIIRRVGLESHIHHRAAKLSGGQKQRLAIARALAKDTPIIVADEPTGNLDSKSGDEIFALLHEISADRLVVVVTHNYESAAPYATRKIRLFDGEVVEDVHITKRELPVPPEREEKRISPARQALSLSLMGIIGQPKKSLFLFLVVAAMVFFTFIAFGGYTLTMIEVDYNDVIMIPMGLNDYPERLIVVRKDRAPLTPADKDKIAGVSGVASIIEEDIVVDQSLTVHYTLDGVPESIEGYMNFIATYRGDRLHGRLPENPGELLISLYLDKDEIEKIIPAFLGQTVTARVNNIDYNIVETYTIVGIYVSTSPIVNFRISDADRARLNEPLKIAAAGYEIKFQTGDESFVFFGKYALVVDETLTGYEASTKETFPAGTKLIINGKTLDLKSNPGGQADVIYISPEFFEELRLPQYQYTVNVTDPDKANAVIDRLYDLGYYAVSPAQTNPYDYRELLSIPAMIFAFIGIAVILTVVFLLSYIIIRAVFLSKKRDYAVFRILGLPRRQIDVLILLELLVALVFSYVLLALAALIIPLVSEKLAMFFTNLSFRDYLILILIDLGMVSLLAYRFNRYIAKRNLFTELKGDE